MENTDQLLNVSIIQHQCNADIEKNKQTIEANIKQAANLGSQLIVLQELHSTLYFCQQENTAGFELAETIPGPTTDWLSRIAKQFKIVIVGSLFEKRQAGVYHNTAVVLDSDGSLAGIYRKMHIPDDPGYYEKYYFSPGDLGFKPIKTSVAILGVQVCWDQWFPEGARLMALAGAEILIYPSAIGWHPNESTEIRTAYLHAWQQIQCGHAIANSIPVICSNRHGKEYGTNNSEINFWGNSFICNNLGQIIAQASANADEILSTKLNLSVIETTRKIWPFFRDRRIDAYNDINKRCIDNTTQSKD